mgnify:CR=1 FL=1
MTTTYILMGDYETDGGLMERGRLIVHVRDGKYTDEYGAKISAAEIWVVRPKVKGIRVTCADSGWQFVPDAGECERIGLPVATL